jgi:hypothetical protein
LPIPPWRKRNGPPLKRGSSTAHFWLFRLCTTLRAGHGAELSGIDPAGGVQVSKFRLHQLAEITYSEGNFRWPIICILEN